jgi:hypothetical protein
MSLHEIRYLRRKEIDIAKWNECINQSPNGLIYATSIYLDGLTFWNGLVLNDYEAVMPLPWRKKFGFYYLYQPLFCQQLGIFSKQLDATLTDKFLRSIPDIYALWDIQLNATNTTAEFKGKLRKNYLLHLNKAYEELQNAYSRSAQRNIAKAINAGITVTENIPAEMIISLHRRRFGNELGIGEEDYKKLALLLTKLWTQQQVYFVAAQNKDEKVIASSAYLLFKNRLTFIINGNLPESLQSGATHFLKDYVIKKFEQHNLVMDFEGSDDPNFARFYEQFGARDEEYYLAIRNNKLPWPFKLFKPPL